MSWNGNNYIHQLLTIFVDVFVLIKNPKELGTWYFNLMQFIEN